MGAARSLAGTAAAETVLMVPLLDAAAATPRTPCVEHGLEVWCSCAAAQALQCRWELGCCSRGAGHAEPVAAPEAARHAAATTEPRCCTATPLHVLGAMIAALLRPATKVCMHRCATMASTLRGSSAETNALPWRQPCIPLGPPYPRPLFLQRARDLLGRCEFAVAGVEGFDWINSRQTFIKALQRSLLE